MVYFLGVFRPSLCHRGTLNTAPSTEVRLKTLNSKTITPTGGYHSPTTLTGMIWTPAWRQPLNTTPSTEVRLKTLNSNSITPTGGNHSPTMLTGMIWTPAWRQPLGPIKVGRTSLRAAPAPQAMITPFVSGISPLAVTVLVPPIPRLLLLPCQKPRLPALLPVVILWPAQHERAGKCFVFTRCRRVDPRASGPPAGPPEPKTCSNCNTY